MLYDVKDSIATITIDRPKKRNAMIPSMIIDMIDMLEKARLFESERTARMIANTLQSANSAITQALELEPILELLRA